ncbi:MAG TPA: hypothetical protein VF570_02790 [Pyrinomonadaceae bacterium]|jgi:hypothetical protein
MGSRNATARPKSDCEGEWKSKINGVREGRFHQLTFDSSGNLVTGKFEGKDIISGTCRGEGATHRLTLTRGDDNNTYVYTGLIKVLDVDIFEIRNGTRTTTPRVKPADAKPRGKDKDKDKDKFVEPEEWSAEKGT